ncbi:MAG: hypothetical protein WD002_01005 [Pseudomonadales bacterium]
MADLATLKTCPKNVVMLFTLSILLITATVGASDSSPPIETLMTGEERKATGIAKLTEEERRALNAWLAREENTRATKPVGPPAYQTKRPDKVHALVVPEFDGWSGNTVFALDNGEVWQQRLPGRFTYQGNDAKVIIKRNLFGFYALEHVASGESIGVTQVR